MIQLNPPIPLETPRGLGMANVLIDYGPEHHLLWAVFIDATGECWTFLNSEVRLQVNETMRPGGVPTALAPRRSSPRAE